MSTTPTGTKRKLAEGDGSVPIRDVDRLYCSSVTLYCAMNDCVPCAYKIGCFDVALDSAFTEMVPNQRPELCPRSGINTLKAEWVMGYRPGMKVLTVGDGDFSFSLAVARMLGGKKVDLVATSYESKETLSKVYEKYEETASELESLGAKLCFQVDATRLVDTLPPSVVQSKFDRICWNFPCTAIAQGQDGQNDAMEINKQLVRGFVENARRFATKRGEVHMCHKTKPPFNQWQLEKVAVELCQDTEPKVQYRGRIVLDRCLLPPYQPRKALHRKSFPCHDACIYVFQVTVCPNDGTPPDQPPTLSETTSTEQSDSDHASFVPIARELILTIREKHLAQAAANKTRKKGRKRRK